MEITLYKNELSDCYLSLKSHVKDKLFFNAIATSAINGCDLAAKSKQLLCVCSCPHLPRILFPGISPSEAQFSDGFFPTPHSLSSPWPPTHQLFIATVVMTSSRAPRPDSRGGGGEEGGRWPYIGHRRSAPRARVTRRRVMWPDAVWCDQTPCGVARHRVV